jgi:hypothetical protein
MAEPIRIEVDSEAQGLEETSRLLGEVSAALVDWLADRRYESVTVRAGERAFGLRRGQSA